jgi:hypothetical protein
MPARPGDSIYNILWKLVENAGGIPRPGDNKRDLLAKYLTEIGGTPITGDTFYDLLVKVVRIKGGTPRPGDTVWGLLVRWIQAEGGSRAFGDSQHDLWRKVLTLGESEPEPAAPEVRVQQGATGITDGQAGAIDFGSIVEGATAPTLIFTVFNDGDADLILGAVNVPAGYTLTEALSGTITPGNSDTFTVRLDNVTPGVKSGSISFSTNDTNENPFNFPITGTVEAAFVEVRVQEGVVVITDGQGSLIDFGQICQSEADGLKTFTVYNDGNVDLTTSGLSVPFGYSVVNGLAASIPPGGNDTFIVSFSNSQAVGTYSGSISFANNDPNENPFNFPITGDIANPISISGAGSDAGSPWSGTVSWDYPANECATSDPVWFGIEIEEDDGGFGDLQFEAGSAREHTRLSDGDPHTWVMRVAAFDGDFNRLTDWVDSSPFSGP